MPYTVSRLAIFPFIMIGLWVMLSEEGIAGRMIEIEKAIPVYFPVKALAIVFEGGSRMDGSSVLGFGAWEVGFGPKKPKAYYQCESPCLGSDPPPMINVQGLKCDNSLSQQVDCNLEIELYKYQPPECKIVMDDPAEGQIEIDCPILIEIN